MPSTRQCRLVDSQNLYNWSHYKVTQLPLSLGHLMQVAHTLYKFGYVLESFLVYYVDPLTHVWSVGSQLSVLSANQRFISCFWGSRVGQC